MFKPKIQKKIEFININDISYGNSVFLWVKFSLSFKDV